jgi:hypothetical protein
MPRYRCLKCDASNVIPQLGAGVVTILLHPTCALASSPTRSPPPSLPRLQVRRKRVVLGKSIGKRHFGAVSLAQLDGADVAAKTVPGGAHMETALVELEDEAALTASLSHRHIVRVMGVVDRGKPEMMVLIEYCAKEALHQILRDELAASATLAEVGRGAHPARAHRQRYPRRGGSGRAHVARARRQRYPRRSGGGGAHTAARVPSSHCRGWH